MTESAWDPKRGKRAYSLTAGAWDPKKKRTLTVIFVFTHFEGGIQMYEFQAKTNPPMHQMQATFVPNGFMANGFMASWLWNSQVIRII